MSLWEEGPGRREAVVCEPVEGEERERGEREALVCLCLLSLPLCPLGHCNEIT